MAYHLQILEEMLDCNCDQQNKIEEDKYLHIIKAWVSHVRAVNVTKSHSQEVSIICTVSRVPYNCISTTTCQYRTKMPATQERWCYTRNVAKMTSKNDSSGRLDFTRRKVHPSFM